VSESRILRILACFSIALGLTGQVLASSRTPTPLERAAQEGDLELARSLLAEGQSQYRRDSALRTAIRAGHRDVTELLISHGARYALAIAAEEGDIELVKYLLIRGQEANLRDSALHVAARAGHKEIVALLLSDGADVNAVRWGNLTPLIFAVTAGYDFRALSGFTNFPFSPTSSRVTTTERSAATPEAYVDIIGLLVGHGADVNLPEKRRGFVPLHYAIFGGDMKIVEALLDHGAEVNPVPKPAHLPSRYVTPLHLAAHRGDLGMCELLIGRGAEVNSKMPADMALWTYNARQTLLHHAVCSGNARLVEFLIGHGAEVDAADSENETPLYLAAEHRDQPIVEILLSHGADPKRKNSAGQTPTSIAVHNGSKEIVKLLATHRARVTIHTAASMGDITTLERLVKAGVSVNKRNLQGRTVLHAAVAAGQLPTVTWLVLRGADLNLADDKHSTPLSTAMRIAQDAHANVYDRSDAAITEKKYKAIIALLISHGATLGFSYGMPRKKVLSNSAKVAELLVQAGQNLEPYTDDKATLLHRAAWWGNVKAVRDLIKLGADVNAADRLGGTPLHAAVQSGCTRYFDVIAGPRIDVLELLIRNGAAVNRGNNRAVTPLHGAASYGHVEALKLLLANGAKIDVVDDSRVTPLHVAAASGSVEAVELLIAGGADPNIRDNEGNTPLLLLLSSYSLVRDDARTPIKNLVLTLARQGVLIDVQNSQGVTPLQQAAALGSSDLLEVFLARGAPVNRESKTGWTALHSAVTNGNAECVTMLLERGARVDGLGRLPDMVRLPRFSWPERTPLHIAVSQGNNTVVKLLIAAGSDVNLADGSGKTPSYLAVEQDHPSTARLLSDSGADSDGSPRKHP